MVGGRPADGLLIEMDALSGLVEHDDGTLHSGPRDTTTLVRVRGTRVSRLNELLGDRGLALINMGGYDAQSIAGVVSTPTHGSGIAFGPFPDVIRSLDLVVAEGKVTRVEPQEGITDPARFAERHGDSKMLIKDDDLFAAAVCGMGCRGIIASLVLDVRPKFWLRERRTVSTWEGVRADLASGVLDRHDHDELLLDPYARKDGRHELLVTTRDEGPEPGVGSPGDGEPTR